MSSTTHGGKFELEILLLISSTLKYYYSKMIPSKKIAIDQCLRGSLLTKRSSPLFFLSMFPKYCLIAPIKIRIPPSAETYHFYLRPRPLLAFTGSKNGLFHNFVKTHLTLGPCCILADLPQFGLHTTPLPPSHVTIACQECFQE